MEAVEDRPREHLSERTCVSRVRSLQSAQVPCAVPLVDDGGRIAVPDQDQVEDQPSGAAVAVEKRVNLLETAMDLGEGFGKDRSAGFEGVHTVYPACHLRGDERPGDGGHAAGEWMDVVLPEAPGGLARRRVGVGCNAPGGSHGCPVNLPHLRERQDAAGVRETGRGDGLPIDPVGCIGVALYLQVLAELLVADRPAFPEQLRDLLEHQRVAFDGGGVMGLLVPDVTPDRGRVLGSGQTAHALAELGDLGVEPAIHVRAPRPAAASGNVFAHGASKLPNIIC